MLAAGYTPFDRDSSIEEIQAICRADYKFEPAEYWRNVSDSGASNLSLPSPAPALTDDRGDKRARSSRPA